MLNIFNSSREAQNMAMSDVKVQLCPRVRKQLGPPIFGLVGSLRQYPAYMLCFKGDGWMPLGTPLFLLHVVSGIHLVLQEKKYFFAEHQGQICENASATARGGGP